MKHLINVSVVAVFFCSCIVTHPDSYPDLSDTFKYESASVHPDYQVVHNSDSTSEVYYSINSKELLYSRLGADTGFTARVTLTYRLTADYESKTVEDSGKVIVADVKSQNKENYIQGKFIIKTTKGSNALLKISLYDLNRKQESFKFLDISKTAGSSQYFFVSKKSGEPLFRTNISGAEQVTITCKFCVGKTLYVRFFKREFPAAIPPFSIMEPKPFVFKADSVFRMQLNDSGSVAFSAPEKGIYNFTVDSNQRGGLTLFRYYDDFPGIRKADQLVPPLRYITSREEFEEIVASKNKKLAVETFWINCAGTRDKGREVIRTYYNRVRYANIYFSSYQEGWKTDRGMIYIIFGPPSQLYRATGSETWVYGEENNLNSLSFNFNRLINPLSDNDFVLQRSSIYNSSWFREVDDIWRQGRIYLQN